MFSNKKFWRYLPVGLALVVGAAACVPVKPTPPPAPTTPPAPPAPTAPPYQTQYCGGATTDAAGVLFDETTRTLCCADWPTYTGDCRAALLDLADNLEKVSTATQ